MTVRAGFTKNPTVAVTNRGSNIEEVAMFDKNSAVGGGSIMTVKEEEE